MKQDKLLNQIEKELSSQHTKDTVNSYMYAIRRFMNRFPKPQIMKLSDIESYFAELKQKEYSVGYRCALLASVKALFNCLIELGIMKEHPCRSYRIGEKKPQGMDFSSLMSIEEMELLLQLKQERYEILGNRNKAMIGLLIYQGITSKELVNLKHDCIDLDKGVIRIKGQGKNKSRTLALKPSQMTYLLRYIEKGRVKLMKSKTDILFLGLRGVPMTTDALHEFIHRLSGAFDKEVSPMSIRSSVISYWLNQRKIPLEHVQVMAGHRFPSTTEKYIKPDEKEQREAVTRLHQSIFG